MARQLDAEEASHPVHVTIVRLPIFTGARVSKSAIFEALKRTDDARFVFPNRTGDRSMALSPWWEAFRRRCALPDLSVHDLRHSFASVAMRERMALATIRKLLGHVLPETTARYAHLVDETIVEAAQRVSGGLAGNLGLSA